MKWNALDPEMEFGKWKIASSGGKPSNSEPKRKLKQNKSLICTQTLNGY
jgi:hypothetical protein